MKSVGSNPTPRVDYLSRDYAGLRQSLFDFSSENFPDWQPASEGDFGSALIEAFAYMGDLLGYYTDRAQMENYLETATQRESVLGISYLLGYLPTPGTPAKGTVTLTTDKGLQEIIVPAGTQIMTPRIELLDSPISFETNKEIRLVPAGPGLAATPIDVGVTEGTTVQYVKIGESTGLPNQTYLLPNKGVYSNGVRIYVEDANGSTVFPYGTGVIESREWLKVDHLLDAGANDQVFETTLNVDNTSQVTFGDDINGAIPSPGLQIFASYRYGVGGLGNVNAGLVFLINSTSLRGVHVKQDATGLYRSDGMTGGANPESTDSIRYNAPRAYRTQNRAINEQDFLDLALGVEGVTKASVVVGSFTSVTVYITGPDGKEPTQALKDYVVSKFRQRTLIGVSTTVASPTFIPINFGNVTAELPPLTNEPVILDLYDQYSRVAVQANVEKAITSYITNLPFGKRLTVGNLYNVISTVDGVRFVEIPVMARADSAQVGTNKITPRVWEVFSMGTFKWLITGGVNG